MIKPFTSEYFDKYLKFESDANKAMHSLKDKMSLEEFKQVFKKLKSLRKKKPISYNIIKTFYEQPEKFFGDYHSILEKTTFFDYAGNSIFSHLFYVLYVDYKRRNNIGAISESEKNLNFQVYESKFESFLKEYERYFLIQDIILDTPLHKIAKRKDKGFFIELYQKLKKINLISNELLLTNNIENETICTYVLNEIKYNLPKLKNEEFYYNFIKDHHSIYESFSKEDQLVLKNFSSKTIFEIKQYKEENFNEIFNNLNDFITNNMNSPNLFGYIYFPFTTNINYLNCVFLICSKDEDYNKLFDLVSKLSKKKEVIDKICISELCIVDHIKYVIRKIGLYNRKVEQVYNYAVKLIKEILSDIMKSKDKIGIKNLIGRKRFKKGLISNVMYNHSLSFEKKIVLFDLLNEMTKGIFNKYIERKTYNLYRFFKLCEKEEITKNNIDNLLAQNAYIKKVFDANEYYEALIDADFVVRDKTDVNETDTYISERIKTILEFLDKNYCNSLKYIYNLSNEYIEKILYALYTSAPNKYNVSYFISNSRRDVKDITKRFVISNKKVLDVFLYPLTEYMANNQHIYFDYMFSSEFDFSYLIDYKEITFNDIIDYWKIGDRIPKYIVPYIEYKLLKGKPFEDKIISSFMILSSKLQNINILLSPGEKNFERILLDFNNFYKRNLIGSWNLPFDYSKLAKTINRYIIPLSKVFIKKKEVFKGIIKEICPNLDFEAYFRAVDLVTNDESISCYIYLPKSVLDNELPEETVNETYLNLIFIYIRKKFDNQIPNLSVFLFIHLLKADYEIFINKFEDSFKQGNVNNFLNYIYFTEPCYSDEKYNIVNYLKKNNNSFLETLNKLKEKYCSNYKMYMEVLYPYLKGYAFIDDNNNSKIIPYHKYTDFNEYFERLKYHKYSNEIHIRALAYYDIRKRSNNNEEDNTNFNFICKKLYDEKCSFMDMLKEPGDEINKHLLKKIISIIDYISKETINREYNLELIKVSKENSEHYEEVGICDDEDNENNDNNDNNNEDNEYKEGNLTKERYNKNKEKEKQSLQTICFDYLNLYELFVCIKEEKKTFFDICNKNPFFIAQTSKIFDNLLEEFKTKKYINIDKKKIEYMNERILEFYKMENEDKYLSKLIIYNKNEFLNSFINKIKKPKDKDKEIIKKQYELFLNDEGKTNYISSYMKIMEIFFENNEEYFYNCLNCNKSLFEGNNKDNINYLFICLMNKNIEKFINSIPEFNNLFENNLNKLKNAIIKSIIKCKKFELFFSQNIKNHTNIFSNFDDSLLILNFAEDNKNASKYVMNKIKELFCQNDDNKLFIGFIKNTIINQYVFETTLKIVSKKKDKNFVEANKSIIFESLKNYCIKNAYYYVDNLLKFLNNYLSMEELQSHIFTYELTSKMNTTNNRSVEEGEDNNDQDEDEEDKYLLFNCLTNFKKNYETIAVLLNYCPSERIYLYVFPFIYDFDGILANEYSNYVDYFSKSKNRDIIKSLNKNFYNVSLFLESLKKQYNYIGTLPEKVQCLFNYYLTIIILQITPQDLLSEDFYDSDNEELNKVISQREEMLKRYNWKKVKKSKFKNRISELDLFMIFALYEIRGTPLVSISKYLPEFYLKIDNYCKTFKNLKIPELCLKDSFDVRFNDNYLINNLKNQKAKLLKKIEIFPNLIFIIQKEYGKIFDISESNEDVYYQQLIYNLISNRNIYSFSNDEKRTNDYLGLDESKNREDSHHYSENDEQFRDNFIQETILSLKDFTRCSSLIIKKSAESYNSDSKGKIFDSYSNYLSHIKSICSYFMSQSRNPFENQDKTGKINLNFSKYDLFILKETLFQNDIDKIAALKNSIDINQIKFLILEQIRKYELNKIQYFDLAINWLDDYLKLNSVSKMFSDVSQINLVNYFSYLNICCEVIMDWLRKIGDIIEFSRYLRKKFSNFQIRFKINSNEKQAKEEFGESLYRLGSSIIKNNNDNNLPLISISYYLDENKKDYVETSSGQELIEFVTNKLISLNKFKCDLILIKEENIHNRFGQLYLINKAINEKNINYMYELLFSNERVDENDKNIFNVFQPLFESIFEENKNYIYSYMKETAAIAEEPNYGKCLSLIEYKFYNFFSNYIIPCLLFNYRLRVFCEDIDGYFGDTCYKIYINWNEIIKSINKTKYHKNKNLNELFKIRAINYVINGDSTVRLHIEELYKFIKNKKQNDITETFAIKVVDGKRVKNEFNKLKMILDDNNNRNDYLHYSKIKLIKTNNNKSNNKPKKKIKLKLKLKLGDQNSKNTTINENIYFSTYIDNVYKRGNIPSTSYDGYVPATKFMYGKSKGMLINDAFRNEYLKKDKIIENPLNNLGLNEDENKKISERKHMDYKVKFVNVFDLMFSIKSINRNEIVVCQNNISSVLDEYYEPNTFLALLDYGFRDKKEKEVQLNMDIIEKYINENL